MLNLTLTHTSVQTPDYKIRLREGYKVRKKINVCKNTYLGLDPLPPRTGMEKYYLFFLSFWHHSEQLWKKIIFSLEKSQNT